LLKLNATAKVAGSIRCGISKKINQLARHIGTRAKAGRSRGCFRHSGGGEKDGGGPVTKRLRYYRMPG
jgi:hypothetical protein